MNSQIHSPSWVRHRFPLNEHQYHTLREAERFGQLLRVTLEWSPLGHQTLLELELEEVVYLPSTVPVATPLKCDACFDYATTEDYRGQHKFFVCEHHFRMDDLNFFKALKRKSISTSNHHGGK